MAAVTAFNAKTRFGEPLNRVLRGEKIIITKHDKPVARLIPEGKVSLAKIRKAATELRALRKRIDARAKGKAKLTFDEFKSALESGRK